MENAVKLMHQRNTNCHQMESLIEMLQGMESSVSQSTTQFQTQVTFRSTLHVGLGILSYKQYTGDTDTGAHKWLGGGSLKVNNQHHSCSYFRSKRATGFSSCPHCQWLAEEPVYPKYDCSSDKLC